MGLERLGARRTVFALTSLKLSYRALVLAVFCCMPVTVWSSDVSLRVAFVYNFMKFIDWPKMAPNQALRLCALGGNGESRSALNQLQGKSVNKKVVELIYMTNHTLTVSDIHSCNIIYQPLHSYSVNLPAQLPDGVLLVVDEPVNKDTNISISLLQTPDGRVEFEINPAAVANSGVTISSQLLKLARNTKDMEAGL